MMEVWVISNFNQLHVRLVYSVLPFVGAPVALVFWAHWQQDLSSKSSWSATRIWTWPSKICPFETINKKKKKAYKSIEGDQDKTKKTLRLLCKNRLGVSLHLEGMTKITLKEADWFSSWNQTVGRCEMGTRNHYGFINASWIFSCYLSAVWAWITQFHWTTLLLSGWVKSVSCPVYLQGRAEGIGERTDYDNYR